MSNVDIKGLRFGRLVAVSLDFSKSRKAYLCKCDCGNKKVIMRQSLINGCTSSCGCIKKKYNHPKGYNTKTYKLWHTMIRRCHNKKSKDYKRYSSKGIIVCDRWQGLNGFVNFISDMGERTSDLHSIDRIDNDGIYTPENCRWATKEVQSRNQRIYVNNKTGVKGVSWDEKGKRWISSIYNNKKAISLGRYTVFKDAVEARLDAEEKYWGFRTEYNIEL